MKTLKPLIFTLLILTFSVSVYAADSIVVNRLDFIHNPNLRVVIVDWVDSPALTLESASTGINDWLTGWYLFKVQTIPGAGAAQPDDNYELDITDTQGHDILGGEGSTRDDTNTEEIVPKVDATYIPQPCISAWTFTISSQTTAAGTGVAYLFFSRY